MPNHPKSSASAEVPDAASPGASAQSADSEGLFRIEQVSELTGLTKRTLRYYEERGLLDAPTRTDGNYRLYSAAEIEHIKRVKHFREVLGASLAEIKEMVDGEEARQSFRDEWERDPDPASRTALLDRGKTVVERQLDLVNARMAELQDLRDELMYKLRRYDVRLSQIHESTANPASSDPANPSK